MSPRPVAFFDFDGTLTYRDSLIPFLRMVRGSAPLALDLLSVSPWLLGYALRITRNDRAKEALFGQALAGTSLEDLRSLGRDFAETHINGMLRSDTFARLRWHQSQGHRCVLVSASLDVYLEPWAERVGIDACLASSLEADAEGVLTGKFEGADSTATKRFGASGPSWRALAPRGGPMPKATARETFPCSAWRARAPA
ncbi:HAD-IB family hydrolase [Acidihalobacter prosperus]|uniref:Phosphoserine phosphatase n=1 Tax=Acidihalobacter prosperus TaxID=160660 RepID=A0A1A6C620_9GAMM|nr:HAD-IB family hydrolase [Acidihalobacter prosperus]OBS09990.1 Phosphoserine phosphatase [Acidihalobacter prosperus]